MVKSLLLGAALACVCLAQSATEEIRKAEMSWVAAVQKNDLSALGQILANDLVYTHSTGIVESKSEYLSKLKSGAQKYASIEHSDLKIQDYGNAGVLTATVRMTGATKGVPFDNKLRVIHVWVKQGGNWKLAAHQTTRLP
jgi:ketosteroid isomerase-like protein